MSLTDSATRQAKATGHPYTLGDSDGLSLAVSAHGRKSWHFRYYWHATQKRMSLSTYPEVTLREAGHLRDHARVLLSKGINPRLDRKRNQQAVRLTQENSFEAIYQQWLTHRGLELQDGRQSTLAQMTCPGFFNPHLLSCMGKSQRAQWSFTASASCGFSDMNFSSKTRGSVRF